MLKALLASLAFLVTLGLCYLSTAFILWEFPVNFPGMSEPLRAFLLLEGLALGAVAFCATMGALVEKTFRW